VVAEARGLDYVSSYHRALPTSTVPLRRYCLSSNVREVESVPRFQIVFRESPGHSRSILVDQATPTNGVSSHQGNALVVGSVVRIDGSDWLVTEQTTVADLLQFVCTQVEPPPADVVLEPS